MALALICWPLFGLFIMLIDWFWLKQITQGYSSLTVGDILLAMVVGYAIIGVLLVCSAEHTNFTIFKRK